MIKNANLTFYDETININMSTIDFYFAEFVNSVVRISTRIGNSRQSLVVVDDVLTMNKAGGVKDSWYRASCEVPVFVAKFSL